tara:strand:- start:358 stop:717 length:360 start_codon:yes stop_codon:yes gene_type:complete
MKWLYILISTCSIFAGLYVNSVRADSGYVWCSTDNWDARVSKMTCRNHGGKEIAILTVGSNPSNADVYIDNQYKGKTELKLHGPLAYYSIRIELDGYIAFQQKIRLSKDMNISASLLKE